jgi:hypothetical protein
MVMAGEAIEGARVLAADAEPGVADGRHARWRRSCRQRLPAHAEHRRDAAGTDQTTRTEPHAQASIGGRGGFRHYPF